MLRPPSCRRFACVVIAAMLFTATGCPKQSKEKPIESRPADGAAPVPTPTATQPAPSPTPKPVATQPAPTLPASTYVSRPPYPVKLYVRSPKESQPGWLTILKLQDESSPATAFGEFPEQNRIQVDTTNVQQIRIHVGHLPLRRGKSIALHIDGQSMEIRRKKGSEFVTMERTPAGVWRSAKADAEK